MGIIANLFGWFRMSENSNTETPSTENSRPTLGYAYDSRPGLAVRASNSTNEYSHLRPTLGNAHDSRPRIDTTSGWAVTSRDLIGNLSTDYYSDNDVWNMPTVTGRDLVHEFERYMEERRSSRARETEELIKQSARLDQINHFRDSVGYLIGQVPNISSDEVVKLANIIHAYSHLNLDAEGKTKVLQWLFNVVEHCSHSTEEPEDDNSVDL